MRYLMPVMLLLAGCSEAERSATTPAPKADYVAASNMGEADAKAAATRFCRNYHAEPAVPADHADTLLRFECAGRGRAGESFFAERLGL